MIRYQISIYADWFNQGEIIEIVKAMQPGDKLEIIKLDDAKQKGDEQ